MPLSPRSTSERTPPDVMMLSRDVKRVPLDFDWPVDKVWRGYLCDIDLPECPDCDQTGMGREARAVEQAFYAFGAREDIAWRDKLGQDEVDNLWRAGRLRRWRDGKWDDGDKPPTAAEVNAANGKGAGMIGNYVHDAINRWVLTKFRCKRLGITVECPQCDGHANVGTPEQRQAAEDWKPTEPPTGEGWQLWESVSEGSPITPVFASRDELAAYAARELHAPGTRQRLPESDWLRIIDGSVHGSDIHSGALV